MEDNIVRKGCLSLKNKGLSYTLTSDGVLTISGSGWLYPVPAPDANPYYDDDPEPEGPSGWSEYISEFKDMDFHTARIEEGIRGLDTFSFRDCKSLRKIILPNSDFFIHARFAEGSPIEYFEEGGLLFLGSSANPRQVLIGCSEEFKNKILEIPEGTVTISDEAFWGKEFIEEVKIPNSLRFLGWYTFAGTSIRHLFLPDGNLANPEWIMAFDSDDFEFSLKSLSLPMSMYEEFLKEKMWYLNLGCEIKFRAPGSSEEKDWKEVINFFGTYI